MDTYTCQSWYRVSDNRYLAWGRRELYFWGALHGTVRILEKCIEKKELYIKIPKALKWIFTMLIVSIGWQAFRFSNIKELFDYYKILFGIVRFNASDIFYQFVYFSTRKQLFYVQ